MASPLARRSRPSWSRFAGKAMKNRNHLQKPSDCLCHINSLHNLMAQKMSLGHGIGGTQRRMCMVRCGRVMASKLTRPNCVFVFLVRPLRQPGTVIQPELCCHRIITRRTAINQQSLRPKEKGGKVRQETTERLPPPIYKSPSFSPSINRRHPRQEEGGAPRTSGACSGSTSSRASSWLISSSSTSSQALV